MKRDPALRPTLALAQGAGQGTVAVRSTPEQLLTASCPSAVIETEPFLTRVNYPTTNLKPTMSSIQS